MRTVLPAVLVLACAFPVLAADPSVSVIRVTATYPGADARTLDETVLTAIFRQINGVEGMTRIESEARNDGTGTLTVHFVPKTDLNLAEVQVQNRVNLAVPRIPEPCRQLGISVRKVPVGSPTFWLALTSTDETHDAKSLANYAAVFLKNDLNRILGVTDVRVVGMGEFAMQVWLNMDRLTAYKLTASDVIDALRRQNTEVAASGVVGGRYAVAATGRLAKPEQFASVILRANADGEVLRIRDVARVEIGSAQSGFSHVNGKPAALIAVTAWPGRVTAEQFRKAAAVGELPPGMRLDVVADRTADRFLLIEVGLPGGTTLERTEDVVTRATELICGLPGKPATFALAKGRQPTAAAIFVKLPANGGPTVADVDKALDKITGASIRIGDLPPKEEPFPVRIALTDVTGITDPPEDRFGEVADRVVAKLMRDKSVAAPAAFPASAAPQYAVDVDQDKCAARGVELKDLFTTLQVSLGGVHATDFHKFGRGWRVTVQAEPQFARNIEDLNQLKVRNTAGEMVPLDTLMKIRKTVGPTAVVRVNGYRAINITAALAPGKTPAETAAIFVKLAQEVLPRGYRVKDLTGPSQ